MIIVEVSGLCIYSSVKNALSDDLSYMATRGTASKQANQGFQYARKINLLDCMCVYVCVALASFIISGF